MTIGLATKGILTSGDIFSITEFNCEINGEIENNREFEGEIVQEIEMIGEIVCG